MHSNNPVHFQLDTHMRISSTLVYISSAVPDGQKFLSFLEILIAYHKH